MLSVDFGGWKELMTITGNKYLLLGLYLTTASLLGLFENWDNEDKDLGSVATWVR